MFAAASIWGTWVIFLSLITLPGIYITPITFVTAGFTLLLYVLLSPTRQAFFQVIGNRPFLRQLAIVALMETFQTSLFIISFSLAVNDGGSVMIPLIRSTAGIITPLLTTLTSKERFVPAYLFYGTLSTIGTLLIFSQGGIELGQNLSYVALVMVVVSVVARGFYYIGQREVAVQMVRQAYNPVHVLTIHLCVSSLVLIPTALLYAAFFPMTDAVNIWQQIGLLAVLGLTHTGLGSLLRLIAMRQINAQQAVIIMYFEPVLSVTLSILFLGEVVSGLFFVGAAIVLFSAVAASLYSASN